MWPASPGHDAGAAAHSFGPPHTLHASLDFWDDPVDVYSIRLEQGREPRLARAHPLDGAGRIRRVLADRLQESARLLDDVVLRTT